MKRQMKKELEELEEAMYEAHRDLFRARFARVNAAEDNEEVVLEFMKYILADVYNTVHIWHPIGGIIFKLITMCEKWMSSAKSQELIDAAERVHHEAESWTCAYDDKCDDSYRHME